MHPVGRQAFALYLGTGELRLCLDFWVSVEQMRRQEDRGKVLQECRDIYAKYFSSSASERLPVPEALLTTLKETLRVSYSKVMFDALQTHLRTERLQNVWLSYSNSPQFDAALQSITDNKKGPRLLSWQCLCFL